MGANFARELADGIGGISLETAIRIHLQSNHFPPVHEVFMETAIEAINRAADGDWYSEITMPNGLTRTVHHIVDGLHLHNFVEADDDF